MYFICVFLKAKYRSSSVKFLGNYTFYNQKTFKLGRYFFSGNGILILFSGFFFPFIFISWRLITLQYCSGFFHTLTWITRGFTCVPHPDPPSRLPLHPTPLGLPSAPAPSTCLMPPATKLCNYTHREIMKDFKWLLELVTILDSAVKYIYF